MKETPEAKCTNDIAQTSMVHFRSTIAKLHSVQRFVAVEREYFLPILQKCRRGEVLPKEDKEYLADLFEEVLDKLNASKKDLKSAAEFALKEKKQRGKLTRGEQQTVDLLVSLSSMDAPLAYTKTYMLLNQPDFMNHGDELLEIFEGWHTGMHQKKLEPYYGAPSLGNFVALMANTPDGFFASLQ